jgi:hypothetical protein
MPNFSPTDAAFEGFRFTRERPGAVAAWAGATLVFNLFSGLMGALIGGSAMVDFQTLAQQAPTDWSAMLHLAPRLAPALLVTLAINLAGSAVVYPSALRSFIGIDHRVSFRAGQDERRILLLLLGFGLIYFVVSSATGVVSGLVANLVGAFSAEAGHFIEFVGRVALIALPLVVIVRLSLAPVIAVDRKRINFMESWVSTKGHFWPLAVALVLSIFIYLVVAFVAMLLVVILSKLLSLGTGGVISGPSALTGASQTDLASFLTPAVIFSELITAVLVAMVLPVVFGPLVRAYQAYDAPDAPARPVPA